MTPAQRFAIIGSGLAGALLACYLGKAGHSVTLYEKRRDPRGQTGDQGRSINLALSTRGLHALEEIGLAEEVLQNSVVMRGRMIHHPDGSLTFQPYGKDESEVLHSVSRQELNRILIEAALKYPSVKIQFEQRCKSVDLDTGEIRFVNGENEQNVSAASEVIIGADGAYSAVRQAMQRRERFDYSQGYLAHGYKELTIPPGPHGTFQMEKHALHIWPRGGYMMIALPNLDGSFTCTLFWPYEGANSFAALRTDAEILAFFQHQFPDAVPLLPDLIAQYRTNPVGPLVTIRCRPWHHAGRVVLIGDACHAVVPFLGQGMNAAFEDCSVLMQCLQQHPDDFTTAFTAYERRRKPHLDTLADLCVENFQEMRDRVGSRFFVIRKKLALWLHALFPRWYVPLYTMVEFTRIPYADAVKRARRQNYVVAGVMTALVVAVLMWAAFK